MTDVVMTLFAKHPDHVVFDTEVGTEELTLSLQRWIELDEPEHLSVRYIPGKRLAELDR